MGAAPQRAINYRHVLRINLQALLAARGLTPPRLRARSVYLAGVKKGKKVSKRTIDGLLSEQFDTDPGKSSPSLDALAAIAAALEVPLYYFFVPGLDPLRPPVIWSEQALQHVLRVSESHVELVKLLYGEPLHAAEQPGAPSGSATISTLPDRPVPSQVAPLRRDSGRAGRAGKK